MKLKDFIVQIEEEIPEINLDPLVNSYNTRLLMLERMHKAEFITVTHYAKAMELVEIMMVTNIADTLIEEAVTIGEIANLFKLED